MLRNTNPMSKGYRHKTRLLVTCQLSCPKKTPKTKVFTVFLRIGEAKIVFFLGSEQAQYFHKFHITHTFKQSRLNISCKTFAPFHYKKGSG